MQQVTNNSVKKPAPVIKVEDFLKEPEEMLPQNSAKTVEFNNIYIPDWNNRPPVVPPVLSLAGVTILSHQNTSSIIANPGSGKSSIMEAIGAKFLNPIAADGLGFEVDPSCRGIIIIDNERTNTDVWNSFSRMCRRAGIREGDPANGVILAGLRSVARLKERISTIEQLLESNPCSLLLIDGAGDLVYDTNDLEQAIECRIWLREITVKYNLSILTTLHPNPNSEKPRGHQGSEICREAECVMIVKPHDDHAKIITSDFEHGKNRNNPKLTCAFTWSDENKMFVSADYDDLIVSKQTAKDGAKRNEAEKLAKKALPGQTSLKHVELVDAIMNITSMSEETAKRRIRDMTGWGIVTKHDDGYYRFNIN